MKDNNVFGRDCEIVFFVDNDLIKRCEIVGKKNMQYYVKVMFGGFQWSFFCFKIFKLVKELLKL